MVIFDEFHERSLNADLGLALCLDAQAEVREDLRILVMSATLDATAVAQLLGDAPVVTAEGTCVRSRDALDGRRRCEPRRARRSTSPCEPRERSRRRIEHEPGDVLAFLPGQAEIRRAQQLLEEHGLPRRRDACCRCSAICPPQSRTQRCVPATRSIARSCSPPTSRRPA